MTRQENNPEAKQPGRNRLGKLYPSLVNTDVLPDESLDAAQNNQHVGSIDQTGWHTKLNIEALSLTLTESTTPLEVLKHFVTTTFLREKDSHRKGGSVAIPPSDFELHLAQRLKDAGVLDAQDITIPAAWCACVPMASFICALIKKHFLMSRRFSFLLLKAH